MTHAPRRSSRLKQQQTFPEGIPSHATSEGACGACLLALEESRELATLSVCPHVFHANCLISWAVKENSCPQCKRRFSELAVYNDGVWERTTKVAEKDQDPLSDSDDAVECSACGLSENPDQLLLCDGRGYTCDRAYHIYCVGLKAVPMSDWFCPRCDKSCGKKGWTCQSCGQTHARKATTKCNSCGQARSGANRSQGRDGLESVDFSKSTTSSLGDFVASSGPAASAAVGSSQPSCRHPTALPTAAGPETEASPTVTGPLRRKVTSKAASGLPSGPGSTSSSSGPAAAPVKSERPDAVVRSAAPRADPDDDLEVVRRDPRASLQSLPVVVKSSRPCVKAERKQGEAGTGRSEPRGGSLSKSRSSQKLHDNNFSLWSALNPRMSVGRVAPPTVRVKPGVLEIVAADISEQRAKRSVGPPPGLVPGAPGVTWAPGPCLHVRWVSAGLDDAALLSRVRSLDNFLSGQRAIRCRVDVAHNLIRNLDPLLDCISRHSLVLTRLSANYNRIGDEGAHALAEWITQYDIFVCEVNLEHNEITGTGLVSVLSAFHGNPQYPGSGDEDSDSGRPVFLRFAGNRIESPSTVVGSLEDVRSTVCAGTADCEPARGICGSGVEGVKMHLHQVLFQRPRKLGTDAAGTVAEPKAGARRFATESVERQESRMRAPRFGNVFPTVPQPTLPSQSPVLRSPAAAEWVSAENHKNNSYGSVNLAMPSKIGSLGVSPPREVPRRKTAFEVLGPCKAPDVQRSKKQRTAR